MSKWLLLPLMLAPLPPPLSPDFWMPSALRLPLGMSLCPLSLWHPVKDDGPRMMISGGIPDIMMKYNQGSCYIHMESIIFPTSMASKDWYEKNHLTSRKLENFWILNLQLHPLRRQDAKNDVKTKTCQQNSFQSFNAKSVLLIFFHLFWVSRHHLFITWYQFLTGDAARCYHFRDRKCGGGRYRWDHWVWTLHRRSRRNLSNFWWLFFSSETQPGIPSIFGGLSSSHLVIF